MAKRDATQAKNVSLRDSGKLNMVDALKFALTVGGSVSKTFNRFYRYSYLNVMLVYMQTGKVEPIATYKKWEALGRKVNSGPGSGLFINHPKFAPDIDPATGKPKVVDGKRVMKFIGTYLRPTVFQMFQTEGPEPKFPSVPDWDYSEALSVLDIATVPFQNMDGNVAGYSKTVDGQHQLSINPANHGEPLTTAIHEIAHIVLGHTNPEFPYHDRYHRSVAEFQAEAVAYLVLNELEVKFNASESRGYIQGWLNGRESDWLAWSDEEPDNMELLQDKTIRAIFAATDTILVAGRKKHWDKLKEESEA